MADKTALNMIGWLLCAATVFVIAMGGYAVRSTLQAGTEVSGNTYGLQAIRIIDAPRIQTLSALAADRS
ncbi:MAG TPA: hypothetical protein VFP74_05115 [Pseudolabrys sp.]|jgi:hypothetical protein|nr:hypothetical protein [Pseudolabrys sp.]